MFIPEGFADFQYLFDVGTGDGAMTHCGWFLDGADFTTPENVEDIAQAFNGVVDQLAGPVIYTALRVVLGQADPEAPVVFEVPVNHGGAAVASMPPNTSYLVKKITGLGGRKNRGRMYLPCPPENAVDDKGLVLEDPRGDLNVAVAAWVNTTNDELVAEGATVPTPVILHTDELDTPTPIFQFLTDGMVATQRRRLR